MIEQIKDKVSKRVIARNVLEALRDWFEVDESREKYIAESADQIFIAAREDDRYAGFLCLKQTGKDTVELAVMGVLKDYHRKGIGRQLFEEAKRIAVKEGYSFMQVKTVQMGVYEDYDITKGIRSTITNMINANIAIRTIWIIWPSSPLAVIINGGTQVPY